MSILYTQADRPVTLSTPLGPDVLLLQKVSLQEEFNRPFRMEILARSVLPTIPTDKILGEAVTVTMHLPRGGQRYVNGWVRSFRQERSDGPLTTYRLEVVPWLALLELGHDCAIYQGKTVPQILDTLFSKLGYDDYEENLLANYNIRGVCVQYDESFLNFVNRLCEDEGIFYYFTHTDSDHTLCLVDDNTDLEPLPGYEKLSFHAHDAPGTEEHVFHWEHEATLTTGKVTLGDYDYMKPKKSLLTTALGEGEGHSDFEDFSYPGHYEAPQDFSHYAKVRQQAHTAAAQALTGEASCLGLATGTKITFENMPLASGNAEHILIATELTAENADYVTGKTTEKRAFHCRFRAIPSAVPFRPERRTPRPRIYGTQTAVVTGPEGQNPDIPYVSKLGSIKVQFHWDRYGQSNNLSSGWIRVAQFFAGPGYGAMFCPRVGNEVLVIFEDGDPDRPIVAGSLYNADNKPPLQLPKFAQRCYINDDGGNAISFIPEKNSQSIVFYSPTKETIKVVGASDSAAHKHVPTMPGFP